MVSTKINTVFIILLSIFETFLLIFFYSKDEMSVDELQQLMNKKVHELQLINEASMFPFYLHPLLLVPPLLSFLYHSLRQLLSITLFSLNSFIHFSLTIMNSNAQGRQPYHKDIIQDQKQELFNIQRTPTRQTTQRTQTIQTIKLRRGPEEEEVYSSETE